MNTRSLAGLYARAFLTMRRSFDRTTRFDSFEQPAMSVPFDALSYRAYCQLVGSGTPETTLPAWLYVLTQKPMMAALTDARFPFPVNGMVHLGNVATLEREPDRAQPIDVSLSLSPGELLSIGHEVHMYATLAQHGERIGTNEAIALVRCPAPDRKRSARVAPTPVEGTGQVLSYSADAGRRYARVSGDWNPIHLWPMTARLLGFRQPIAHGMYSVSRINALLHDRDNPRARLEVSYRNPVALPGEARLYRCEEGAATHFELRSMGGDRVLLQGRLS